MTTLRESQSLIEPNEKLGDIRSVPIGTKTKSVIQDPTDINNTIILASGDVITTELKEGSIHAMQSIGYGSGDNPGEGLPALYVPFDGPEPYTTDFTGSDESYNGVSPSVSATGAFVNGKYQKGRILAVAGKNWVNYQEVFTPTRCSIEQSTERYFTTSTSIKMTKDSSGSDCYAIPNTGGTIVEWAGNTIAYSAKVYSEDGATPRIYLRMQRPGETLFPSVLGTTGPGWQNLQLIYDVPADATSVGLFIGMQSSVEGDVVFFSDMQLEVVNQQTPFMFGDMPGCSWDGVSYDSSVTRVAQSASFLNTVNPESFTVGTWWQPSNPSSLSIGGGWANSPFVIGNYAAANSISVGRWGTNLNQINYYYVDQGGVLWTDTIAINATFTPLDWLYSAVTWDGTNLIAYLYTNGTLYNEVLNAGLGFATGALLNLNLSNITSNSTIDDLIVFNRALSETEIQNIASSGQAFDPTKDYS